LSQNRVALFTGVGMVPIKFYDLPFDLMITWISCHIALTEQMKICLTCLKFCLQMHS